MDLRTAIVAVICSAILSAGLAVGLGGGGSAKAAPGSSDLKQIRAELVKVNKAIGASNDQLALVNRALGEPTFLSQNITDILREICDNTPNTIC